MKMPAFGSLPKVDRTLLRRSVITCLVVGTALTVVNHGTDLLHGDFRIESSWQIAITFAVPFCVAMFSGVAAVRVARKGRLDPGPFERDGATATFPDLNPSPVLRFAPSGVLLYANPASRAITNHLRLSVGQASTDGVIGRVLRSATAEPKSEAEIEVDGHRYTVKAVQVPEFDFVNVYVTEVTPSVPSVVTVP